MVEKNRKNYSFSLPSYSLMIIGGIMIIFSYTDQPPSELQQLARSYSDIANAPIYLRHTGIFALVICAVSLITFVYDSLLMQYVISSLMLALIIIQLNAALIMSGDDRIDSVQLMLKLENLMNEMESIPFEKRMLIGELEMTLDCCGTSNGFSWLNISWKDRSDTCCPLDTRDTATDTCPFQLSKLMPCDFAGRYWVQFRVWKFIAIYFACAFLEPSIYSHFSPYKCQVQEIRQIVESDGLPYAEELFPRSRTSRSICLVLVLLSNFPIKETR